MSKGKFIIVFAAIATVVAIALWDVLSSGEGETKLPEKNPVRHHAVPKRENNRRLRPAVHRRRVKSTVVTNVAISVKDALVKAVDKTNDDVVLDEEVRKVIMDLQSALDQSKKAKVFELVRKLQQMSRSDALNGNKAAKGMSARVPKSVKLTAIDTLSLFGASGLPELSEFLGDADPEVVQSAIDKYWEAMSDFSLGDRDRSFILIQASKVVNDADSMNMLMFELNNMRHSVAVETMKTMMTEGTEATKAVLPESVSFYTGEENIDTPEKLDDWLSKNPDDQYDEDFYGPIVRK